jgi:hypothetical protein
MRCIAVIEAERPGLDSVLIWEREGTLVAFAYQDGHTTMTRPLVGADLNAAVSEIAEAFQINAGELQRITDWSSPTSTVETIKPVRTRW